MGLIADAAARNPTPSLPISTGGGGGGTGLFGWFGNLAGDVKELGMGLGSLVASGVHDLGRGVAQAIPGRQDWGVISDTPGDQYRLDNLLTALPGAIASDYASRYGGASNIARGLYENPLSYLLDALGVGSLAAGGARIAATGAIKGSEVASLAAEAAKTGLAQAVTEGAAIAPKAIGMAGLSKGLEALSAERALSPLESLAARILPRQSMKLVGSTLEPTVQMVNPVSRALTSPLRRLATRDIGEIESRLGTLSGTVKTYAEAGQKPPSSVFSEIQAQRDLLAAAREGGLTRIERPSVARMNAEIASRRFMAKVKGQAFAQRLAQTRIYEDTLRPFMEADPTLERIGAAYPTGLQVVVPGYERAPWLARSDQALAAQGALKSLPVRVGAGATVQATPLTLELTPDVAQAASAVAPAISERTQTVIGRLRAYADRLQSEPGLAQMAGRDVASEVDATNRLISSLNEALTRKVGIERGELELSAGQQMTDALRLTDMEKMVDQFDSFASSPAAVLDETYAPLRLAHGAQFDEATNAFEGGPSVAELDDAFRAANEPSPTYFPFIDPEKAKASDFFISKQLRGANIYARDPHLGRMKGIRLIEGSYERNPMEAYVRRAARGVRAQETYNTFAQMTQRFGRPIASSEDVPPGFTVVAPDLLFLQARSSAKFGDLLDDLLSRGIDQDSALAQAIEKVTLKNQEDIARLLETGGVKMWAVPKVVTDRLNDAAKYAGFLGGTTRLGYDSVLAGWRGLVLSGSPRWVVNNTLGNSVFAAMQGVKTADVIKLLGANFRKMLGGRSKILEDLRRLPGFEDVASTGFVGSAVSAYEPLRPALEATAAGRALRAVGESRPLAAAKRFGQGMRTLNAAVEDAFRQASFLTAAERQAGRGAITRLGRSFMRSDERMARIMADGFTPAKGAAALQEVNRFFGDYAALGPFERHVIRRWLVPFWSFYKMQGKLLLTFPFESPIRAQVMQGFADVNREMLAAYGPVPDWLEGAIPFGPPGAQVPFYSSVGPNPFNASFQDPFTMLSPVLKMAWEQAKGRSSFTGQPFSDPNIVRSFGSDQAYRIVRDEAGNVIGVEPVADPRPGIGWQALQQIPQFNALASAIAGGKAYDTAPFTAIPGEEGGARYPTDVLAQALKISGLGTTPYDIAAFQQRLDQERQAALTQALSRG